MEDVDIHRTIGWFTTVYPVILDLSYENDLSRQVKEVKETLHKVPGRGIGYGILKYLTADEHKEDVDFRANPQIVFNYLGQFDAELGQMSSFSVARESVGNMQSMKGERDFEIEFSGMVSGGRLVMTVTYNKGGWS
jgi:non-ribosomal peptide synthase protein (TIGR01720 family)